jgi:DNA-directed RNA polymerase specialized sigma24 family protein
MSEVDRPRAFRALSDQQLYVLRPEQLVGYVAAAKRAGAMHEAQTAVHMLLFRYENQIRARVRLRLPAHLQRHADVVADWVLEQLLRSALKLSFTGSSMGEWVSWTNVAIKRQVISFFRTPMGRGLEREDSLPSEHHDDDAPDRIGIDFDEAGVVERMDALAAIDTAIGKVSAEHAAILHAALWDDLPSAEVAALHKTTPQNVDQIKSRFRKELRKEIEARGGWST